MSTSVLLQEKATFLCSGTGQELFWTVNDVNAESYVGAAYHTNIHDNDFRESTLTVLGTINSNNASIKCSIVASYNEYESPSAYLTLLGEFV